MKFAEYRKLAMRTDSKINPASGLEFTDLDRIRHAVSGLVTESAELLDAYKKHIYYGKELDLVNIKEEIGDLFWYLALACDVLDVDLDISKITNKMNLAISRAWVNSLACTASNPFGAVYLHAGGVLAGTKKAKFIDELNYVGNTAAELIAFLGFNLDEILELNINKLKMRYPDKFDAQRAVNRDLDREREVLEACK